jgi:hypothetical protein
MASTVALCNDTLTALGFQGGGVVVPGSAVAVETSAASVAVTGQSALLPTPMPVSSTNGGRQICVQPYLVPGPGSFWLWDFYIGPVDAGFSTATTVWALPYGVAFVNMTTASVVWVAGQAILPGAVGVVWGPPLQLSSPGDVSVGVPTGVQCVTAQGWGAHVCGPTDPAKPSWVSTTLVTTAGPTTLLNQSTNNKVLVRCAPRQKSWQSPSLYLTKGFGSEFQNSWSWPDEMGESPTGVYPLPSWFSQWTDQGTLQSLQQPYCVPPVYAFTDGYSTSTNQTQTAWASVLPAPPSDPTLANATPALCVLNATPYDLKVTYPAYSATGGPRGGPGPVMTTSAAIPPALPISTLGSPGVFCGTLCTLGADVWVTVQVLDRVSGAVVDTVQYAYSSSATEPPATFGMSPYAIPLADCWPFGPPPPPQVDVGVAGVAFTATNAWARPPNATDVSSLPVYPQWPNPANVNITVRTAPLVRLVAIGNPNAQSPPGFGGLPAAVAYLGSSTSGVTPLDGNFQYLGGFNTGVLVVPQGMPATLSPASMQDVLIVEMPMTQDTMEALRCPTAASGNYVPSAFFTTLTLADLQAARAGPGVAAFSVLQAPVALTPYLTLAADDGESVTILVGPTQALGTTPACGRAFPLPAPVPCLPPAQVCPSAAQFVSEVCASPGFSLCRSVVGTQPQSCLGYFSTTKSAGGVFQGASTLAEACQQTCALDQDASTGTACRTLALTHCTGPAATALPECACVRMQDSTAPVNVLAGSPTTFPQFQEWFQTNFKGGGLPQLLQNVQCWWPACNGPDAGLTYFTPCPEVITECFALVSKVTATNDSKVNIDLRNACGVSQQPSTATTGVGGSAGGPPPPIPAKNNIVPIVLAAVITLLVVIIIIAAWAAAGKVLRSRTLAQTLGGAGGGAGGGGSR